MSLRIIFAVAAITTYVAEAIPIITFPLNSQVPPVARVSQPFIYAFSESTFSSTLPLTYSLSNAPSWLSLDSSTRTLSGTPSAEDVGSSAVTGVDISLVASDSSGSVTLNATLVVSTNPTPITSIPLSSQLTMFGTSSLPSTILYHPSTAFNFSFKPETFTDGGANSNLSYYSVTLGNTPLPSWIQFDGSSLSFSGRTPDYQSLIQPPQTFGLQIIATDVEGFSGASIPFEIEVGVHLLAFKNAELVINASAGVEINFTGLSNNLELDGSTANLSSLASIMAQTPSWLSFDNTTFSLSGTVPEDIVPMNISVQATDIYGDIGNATIYIDIATALFDSQIGALNVTSGSPFSFDIGSYVKNRSDVEITANFSPLPTWISWDAQTFIMSGNVPKPTPYSKIVVTLTASSKSGGGSDNQSFDILVLSTGDQHTKTSSLASHSSTSTRSHASSDASPPASMESHKRLSRGVIAAIVVPICLAVLAVAIALCCCLRRRSRRKQVSGIPEKADISSPNAVSSSVVDITTPTRTIPPPTLELDTSGFTFENSSSTYTDERKRRSRKLVDNPLRRSQTMSAISGPSRDDFRQSDSIRTRSYSENALSRTNTSWRSTQDSAYPTISSSSRTNSSQRLTRNYSRKGQNRRSGRIKSRDSAMRDSSLSMQRSQSMILNLRDSSFPFVPLDNFSVLSKRTSTQPSESVTSSDKPQHSKRHSRFVPSVDRRTGIGHGSRETVDYLAGLPVKRRSVGHGQNWEPAGVSRDSTTWHTLHSGTGGRDPARSSIVSAITGGTDDLDRVAPLNVQSYHIRQVPPSSAGISESSSSTRPVSRRGIGSSPFFAGGGSMRSSRKSPNRTRTSYADSPTVPEEQISSLGPQAMDDLQEENTSPRDSLGISYAGAREGTRQLRSYLQSRLTRGKTATSMESNESRDSRFESADSLVQSQPNIVVHAHSPERRPPEAEGEDEYEDDTLDDYSEESWETQPSPPRDSLGNIIEYGLGESPERTTSQRHTLVPGTALRSHPASALSSDLATNARMMRGRGRRPLSVDAAENQHSVRAVIEDDYTAYI